MTNSYCVRCHRKTPNEGAHVVRMANGRHAIESHCGVCGTKKFEFVSSSRSRGSRKSSTKKPHTKRRKGSGIRGMNLSGSRTMAGGSFY